MKTIKKYQRFELTLTGQAVAVENPFTEVQLWGIFTLQGVRQVVRGFYAGNQEFKIRFAPELTGQWHVEVQSNCVALQGYHEDFVVTAEKDGHGIVRTIDERFFAHADGTPFYPFGTTTYTWHYQPQAIQEQTLATFAENPFNKTRMLLFPTNVGGNVDQPELFPFAYQKGSMTAFDFNQPNPLFFDRLEEQLASLAMRGVQADLILFHPYENWGFNAMTLTQDCNYLKYVVARLGFFSNIWWSLANEYDVVESKTLEHWHQLGKCLMQEDSYQHLISIHNWHKVPLFYDNTRNWYPHEKPWISHLSIQYERMLQIPIWQDEFRKPVVNDECRYEGNISAPWGNLSPQGMVRQFWEGVCLGGYVTHGETYPTADNYNWVSNGGYLQGASAPRIAFLKKIVEKNDLRLRAFDYMNDWDCFKGIADNGKLLIYLGNENQPAVKRFANLPTGKKYRATLIDTWNMEMKVLSYEVDKEVGITLPQKTALALLLEEV